MVDIREGDVLVLGGVDYPVKSVAEYRSERLVMTRALRRIVTETASTKRSPAVSGGKRGAPVTHLASVACSPLDPVDADTRQRMGLNAPHELKQCFMADADGFVQVTVEELKA